MFEMIFKICEITWNKLWNNLLEMFEKLWIEYKRERLILSDNLMEKM